MKNTHKTKRHTTKRISKKRDPAYYNVPNICFSIGDDFKRNRSSQRQRISRGFDDSETWSLDHTIAAFILPRLKRYFEVADKVIILDETFKAQIHQVIFFLEVVVQDTEVKKEDEERYEEGLKAFPLIFRKLWW